MLNLLLPLRARLESVLRHGDRGATAVEYGLMVALIAAVIITAVALIGTNLNTLFNSVAGNL
jgi:pilus assembly protein Flp/PilA